MIPTNKFMQKLYKLTNCKTNLEKENLAMGLAVGLIMGLAMGLIWGLIMGLAIGLGSLISVVGIAFFQPPALIQFPICIIIIAEMLFWLEKVKPKRGNKFWFTAKRKLINLFKATFIYVEVIGFIKLTKRAIPYIEKHWAVIVQWLGYIGIALIILAIIIGTVLVYIWINSWKYRK